jgi:hypothetical protein
MHIQCIDQLVVYSRDVLRYCDVSYSGFIGPIHHFFKWGILVSISKRYMAFFIYLFSEQGRKQTVVQGNRIIQQKSKLENLCDLWIRLGKLGSRGFPGPRVAARSVLIQEARTQVLRSARTSQITTSQYGGPSKPLSMFNCLTLITDHISSSCHNRFIRSSDSPTGWTRLNN